MTNAGWDFICAESRDYRTRRALARRAGEQHSSMLHAERRGMTRVAGALYAMMFGLSLGIGPRINDLGL